MGFVKDKLNGMLSQYRVLDLTDEKGLFCGKLLGDLGADVIKVEKPGGDPARNIGPFYHDEPHPEKSLFWFAFNTSKKGITLDIKTANGQETFKRLVKSADVVIESFPPAYMDKLGLGYSELEKINPGIIMVSITPFGQTGPYKDYKTSDIVAWAMGGQMYSWGDEDRPPIRISHHSQAYLHAATEAAVGVLMALHYRDMTGEGQQVDVSIHESVVQLTQHVIDSWDMMKVILQRGGGFQLRPGQIRRRRIWPCKDGHVVCFWSLGSQANRRSLPIVRWMDSEGMAGDFLKGIDWESLDFATVTQDVFDRISELTARFFMSHTKAELMEGALKHRATLFPVSTASDVMESIQLSARKFWVELEHPELGIPITYPGAFAQSSEEPPRISCRAPLIGEHNEEVYQNLDLAQEQTLTLKQAKVIQDSQQKRPRKSMPGKLLEGIKVVDFTHFITGPLATKYLSDYGARVIKVEGRVKHDEERTMAPFKDGISGLNRGGSFNEYNTGKLGVTANLANPKGVEIAKKFIAWADIVVENFAGGTMARMGLSYEELKKVKPDIIMVSSCMMGQTGPYANHPGLGPHLTALSGFSHISGWPDKEPPFISAYTDYVAPRFLALAILAALDYRRRTGKGQHLDLSQYENGVHFLAPLILDYAVNQRVADRMGNLYPYAAPHNAYRCRGEDQWCAIATFSDEEWQSFCKVIGNPAWTREPRFSTLQSRKESEDELDKLVEEWTINHQTGDVMSTMQVEGVPAGVLQTGEDLLEYDPQLKHRHFFCELEHPEIGKYRAYRPSFMLSKCPYELRRAPLLGEHNEYVLKEVIGMSDEEIAELVMEGIVE
ncbi:CaiB/BaiF CoA transferase family protein [Chloroflexota bacterium]